jgi:Uma2 family endonuclease
VAEPARRLWTLDEFLAFDDGTDKRYELFDGQIVAMAPASDVHGALVMRIGRQIGNALRPRCEVIAEAGIVPPEPANSWYQADLAVTCSGLSGQQFIPDPVLIVEVLSPSTATTDRERKLPDYRAIPSLQDILVVSSIEPRIEHFRRQQGGWKIHDLRGRGTCAWRRSTSSSICASCTRAFSPSPKRSPRARLSRKWQRSPRRR